MKTLTEIVEQELTRKKDAKKRHPSPAEIIEAACWMRGDEPALIRNWTKATKAYGRLTRQWCVYALRELTYLSFPEIASVFHMKGHNTVYVAWKSFVCGVEKKTRDDGLNIIRQRAEYLAELNR